MFDPPKSDVLTCEKVGEHVLLVTMNRPEVLNAMNMEMGVATHELLTRLHHDPDWVRCVVLTGAGRAFSAGGDLKVRNTQSIRDWTIQHEIAERSSELRVESPVPWIAAVNGICYAGGLEAALTCDFIYADRDAKFAQTECRIGIMPGAMGTQNLPRAVGERRAKELILSARPFTAVEAHAWGMVNQLCEPGTVVAEALAAAQRIADCAPLSVRQAKKSIHFGLQTDLRTGYRLELEAYYRLLDTEDRREGIAAFNEKRKPRFTGR
ncbi:MAG: enoyl-CoA hydratase/isomerase family protein [Burkholderiales bacterium]|nr:enoyl-CoA hydratase/isomerase family protein [Burkholderiales bacterium]